MTSVTKYKGSTSGEIVQETAPLPEPTEDQVLLRITHTGICGSDVHFRHMDMVLGHEATGIVEKVGPRVREMNVYCPRSTFVPFVLMLGLLTCSVEIESAGASSTAAVSDASSV